MEATLTWAHGSWEKVSTGRRGSQHRRSESALGAAPCWDHVSQLTVLIRSDLLAYTCPPQSWRTCWTTRWWRISPSPPRRSPFHWHGGSFLGSSKNNAMSHSWSSLTTLACKNRGQPLLCGNLLGFHSLVDEEQELKNARDADDDEIPVCLHQCVTVLKKETHQRLIVGGERRCSILLSP